jgi:hypothetical protein
VVLLELPVELLELLVELLELLVELLELPVLEFRVVLLTPGMLTTVFFELE